MMIPVLVVDEVRLACDVIAADLRKQPDIKVVGTATSVEEALGYVPGCRVLLISHTLPGNGALVLTQTVASHDPGVRTLIVGVGRHLEEIIAYIESGAAGYVDTDDSFEVLLEKIRAAARGEALLAPDVEAALLARLAGLMQTRKRQAQHSGQLTLREREVLDLLSQGMSNREIASALTIEVGTVKNHVHSVLRKLNMISRRQLAVPVA